MPKFLQNVIFYKRQRKETTRAGLEPTLRNESRFRIYRLNHSANVSVPGYEHDHQILIHITLKSWLKSVRVSYVRVTGFQCDLIGLWSRGVRAASALTSPHGAFSTRAPTHREVTTHAAPYCHVRSSLADIRANQSRGEKTGVDRRRRGAELRDVQKGRDVERTFWKAHEAAKQVLLLSTAVALVSIDRAQCDQGRTFVI